MIDFLNGYGSALGKAQKKIDQCNGKRGCNSMCSAKQQEECPLRERHRELMHKAAGEEVAENG